MTERDLLWRRRVTKVPRGTPTREVKSDFSACRYQLQYGFHHLNGFNHPYSLPLRYLSGVDPRIRVLDLCGW